jgi:hypothetical protein
MVTCGYINGTVRQTYIRERFRSGIFLAAALRPRLHLKGSESAPVDRQRSAVKNFQDVLT